MTSPQETVLLSCPFCGGDADLVSETPERSWPCYVGCRQCGAMSDSANGNEAIQLWNTRPSPSPEPSAEELMCALDEIAHASWPGDDAVDRIKAFASRALAGDTPIAAMHRASPPQSNGDASELVERLAVDAEWCRGRVGATVRQLGRDCEDAKDLIERQAAEIARLTAPAQGDGLVEAVTEYWGERCRDFDANCCTCRAWQQLDSLRRGAA